MPRRHYKEQFREEACRLVTHQGYKPKAAAQSLGMPENTLIYWLQVRRQAARRAATQEAPAGGPAAGAEPAAMAAQIRELEAKVRRLEMEKEILKKATAYFASQQP